MRIFRVSPSARTRSIWRAALAGTKIHILEAPRLKQVNVLTNHTAFVGCLAFDRTGKKLVSGAMTVTSVSGVSPTAPWSLTFPATREGSVIWHSLPMACGWPAGETITRSGSGTWPARARPPSFLHGHRGAVTSVLFSRDGNQLYTGSDDGTVKVWDVSSQESTNILRHSGWTDDVAFSPDGTLVAVADYGARTAVLWRCGEPTADRNRW